MVPCGLVNLLVNNIVSYDAVKLLHGVKIMTRSIALCVMKFDSYQSRPYHCAAYYTLCGK